MTWLLRRKKFYVLYPEYFDKNISRGQGRRVSLELADEEPHIKKLSKACDKLEIEYEAQPEKAHPTFSWKKSGRLLIPIDKNDKIPKEKLIQDIAVVAKKFKIKKKQKKEKDVKSDQKSGAASKYKTKKNVSARKKKVKK